MPVELIWDNDERTILRLHFQGHTTWDEFHTVVGEAVQAIKVSTHRVDLIFEEVAGMPAGNPLPHMKDGFKRLASLSHFGVGVGVDTVRIHSSSRMMNSFLDLAMRIYGLDPHRHGGYFTSLEQARAKLAELRQMTVG
jgi:hypothetical protein